MTTGRINQVTVVIIASTSPPPSRVIARPPTDRRIDRSTTGKRRRRRPTSNATYRSTPRDERPRVVFFTVTTTSTIPTAGDVDPRPTGRAGGSGGDNSFFFRTRSGFPLRDRNTQDGRVRNEARPARKPSIRTVNGRQPLGRIAAMISEYSQLSDARGPPPRQPRLTTRADRSPLDRRTSMASFAEKMSTKNRMNSEIRVGRTLRVDSNVSPKLLISRPAHLSPYILVKILSWRVCKCGTRVSRICGTRVSQCGTRATVFTN